MEDNRPDRRVLRHCPAVDGSGENGGFVVRVDDVDAHESRPRERRDPIVGREHGKQVRRGYLVVQRCQCDYVPRGGVNLEQLAHGVAQTVRDLCVRGRTRVGRSNSHHASERATLLDDATLVQLHGELRSDGVDVDDAHFQHSETDQSRGDAVRRLDGEPIERRRPVAEAEGVHRDLPRVYVDRERYQKRGTADRVVQGVSRGRGGYRIDDHLPARGRLEHAGCVEARGELWGGRVNDSNCQGGL